MGHHGGTARYRREPVLPSMSLDEIQNVLSVSERKGFRGADWPRIKRALHNLEDMLQDSDATEAQQAGTYARRLGQKTATTFLEAVDDKRQTSTGAIEALFTFLTCLWDSDMCDEDSYDMLKLEYFGYMDSQGLLQG